MFNKRMAPVEHMTSCGPQGGPVGTAYLCFTFFVRNRKVGVKGLHAAEDNLSVPLERRLKASQSKDMFLVDTQHRKALAR